LAAVVCAHVDCHLTHLLQCAVSKTAAALYSSGSQTFFAHTVQYALLQQLTEHLSPLQLSSRLMRDRGRWLLCEYYTYCILRMCKWNYFRHL